MRKSLPDEVIVFNPLSMENYERIADLMLKETAAALSERGIAVSWDEAALKRIAEKAHGQKYGARDIRRVLRDDVEDKIANLIVDSDEAVANIRISASESGITVENGKE